MRQWLLAFFFVAGAASVGLAAKPKSAGQVGSAESVKVEKKKITQSKNQRKKTDRVSAKKKSKPIAKKPIAKKSQKVDTKWNRACADLLDTSVDSTLKLEKSLNRRKSKLSPEEFEGQVQNEMLVVQLNAWVCAISSQFDEARKGASIEEEFLKDYAQRVQSRNL